MQRWRVTPSRRASRDDGPRPGGIARSAAAKWRTGGWLLFVAGAVVLLLAPALVAVAAAVVWLLRERPDRQLVALAAGPAVVLGAAGGFLTGAYAGVWLGMAASVVGAPGAAPGVLGVLLFVGYGVLLGPAAGLAWWGADQWYRERAQVGGQNVRRERLRAEGARRAAKLRRDQEARHTQGKTRRGMGLGDASGWQLGLMQEGDLPWRQSGRRFVVPIGSSQVVHLTSLGVSGTGKSEGGFSLAHYVLEQFPGWQVIVINGKEAAPGLEPSRRLLGHAEALGRTTRMLRSGYEPYDPFRGTTAEVRERLMATQLFSEPHHEAGTVVMLQLALETLERSGAPASQLTEVLYQLADTQRLATMVARDPLAAAVLAHVDPRSWSGTVQRYAADAARLLPWTGPRAYGGWTWEDAQVCCMDLPTSTQPLAARALMRWALSDLMAYLTGPRRPRQANGTFVPLLVMVDELSAVDADPLIGRSIVNALERSRAAGARWHIIAQDPSGLGDDRAQAAVLANSTVITWRQTEAAERLAQLAGSRTRLEASAAYEGRMLPRYDVGSLREQDTFKVHPNVIRGLDLGEAVVLHRSQYARVQVALARSHYRPYPLLQRRGEGAIVPRFDTRPAGPDRPSIEIE